MKSETKYGVGYEIPFTKAKKSGITFEDKARNPAAFRKASKLAARNRRVARLIAEEEARKR
jgi:hypothetical protein